MQSLLLKMLGKKIDVYCGGASSLRGEVLKIEDGVLHLKDADDKTCYVAIDKIMVVWEARDEGTSRRLCVLNFLGALKQVACPKTKTPALLKRRRFHLGRTVAGLIQLSTVAVSVRQRLCRGT